MNQPNKFGGYEKRIHSQPNIFTGVESFQS